MHLIRKKSGFTSLMMVLLMLMITVPFQPILAAMIPTEAASDAIEAAQARENLKKLLARDAVSEALMSYGVDPQEARARIDSLTDAEALAAADKLENLPAGGGAVGVIVGALLIVFLVLLITDIMGYTDVFPFVKSQR